MLNAVENMASMLRSFPPELMDEPVDFLLAMVKGRKGHLAIKAGDAQRVGSLKTLHDGPRPSGYETMRKQGGIVLGVGGDNSPWGSGAFFEGVMTAGFSSEEADAAVMANVVAAGYAIGD